MAIVDISTFLEDNEIGKLKSKNKILRNNIKRLIVESDDTGGTFLNPEAEEADKENSHVPFQLKHLENLKRNVNTIRKTRYELPQHTGSTKPNTEYEADQQINSDRRGHRSLASPTYGQWASIDDMSNSNVLLNKVLYQNEVISTVNENYRQSKLEMNRLEKENEELKEAKRAMKREQFQKESELSEEILRLKQELQKESFKRERLDLILADKQSIIATLADVARHRREEITLKHDLENALRKVEDLKSVNSFSKKVYNDRLADYYNQFEILEHWVQNNVKTPFSHHQSLDFSNSNTTQLLLGDNSTEELLNNKMNLKVTPPSIDSVIYTKKRSSAPKSLKPFALAILFLKKVERRKMLTWKSEPIE